MCSLYFEFKYFSMVNLAEVKKLIEKELKPAKAKIAEYEKKIAEMDESYISYR